MTGPWMATLAQADADFALSVGGWIVMLLSVGFVTGLMTWCIWKVLTTPGETEHLHSQTDIDPGDSDT